MLIFCTDKSLRFFDNLTKYSQIIKTEKSSHKWDLSKKFPINGRKLVDKRTKLWLNIDSLTKLFKIDRTGITRHINNIYKDEELEEDSTCAKIAHMGNNTQQYITKYYNLDMIISIGFRANKEYISSMDQMLDKYLKENK